MYYKREYAQKFFLVKNSVNCFNNLIQKCVHWDRNSVHVFLEAFRIKMYLFFCIKLCLKLRVKHTDQFTSHLNCNFLEAFRLIFGD